MFTITLLKTRFLSRLQWSVVEWRIIGEATTWRVAGFVGKHTNAVVTKQAVWKFPARMDVK